MTFARFAESDRSNHERGGTVSEAQTKRFPLHLPIKIHNESASGEAQGTTGNLSAAGVYIRADASLEIGSPVEFEITLPPDVTGGQGVRCDPVQRARGAQRSSGGTPEGKGVVCVMIHMSS